MLNQHSENKTGLLQKIKLFPNWPGTLGYTIQQLVSTYSHTIWKFLNRDLKADNPRKSFPTYVRDLNSGKIIDIRVYLGQSNKASWR